MGAGFGSFIAQIAHLSVEDRRIAVAAGMGAGIAAIC
jgi:H+/Cl- antiporter ClcA